MILDQLFPAKTPTMTEGTLVAWKVNKGDAVKTGQVVAELQTDKAVMEWEASDNGVVAEILVTAGSVIPVNTIAFLIATKAGEDATAAIAKAKARNDKLIAAPIAAVPAPAATPASAPAPQSAPALAVATPAATTSAALPKGVRISPVAAKVAAAQGIDVRQLKGSGPDGRIVLRDVETAAKAGTAKIGATAKPEKPKLRIARHDGAPTTAIALSPMRQVIGKRLLESKTQIPHFYVTESIDAGKLVDLREQLISADGVKVTINDLIVKAVAIALRSCPKLSATWNGTSITQIDSADISVAVAIPDGLITPIVAKAHTKSVRQIGDEVRVLAKKAIDGKLQPHEFQGGSFTISNLGMYGIESFSAIINPPQVAILAVAGIKDEPVVRHGAVVPGKVLRVTLSADHRAVDGADAAAFLKTLRELLEAPAVLLV